MDKPNDTLCLDEYTQYKHILRDLSNNGYNTKYPVMKYVIDSFFVVEMSDYMEFELLTFPMTIDHYLPLTMYTIQCMIYTTTVQCILHNIY